MPEINIQPITINPRLDKDYLDVATAEANAQNHGRALRNAVEGLNEALRSGNVKGAIFGKKFMSDFVGLLPYETLIGDDYKGISEKYIHIKLDDAPKTQLAIHVTPKTVHDVIGALDEARDAVKTLKSTISPAHPVTVADVQAAADKVLITKLQPINRIR